ncbi:hypothetical protein BH20ACI2_BH20ACI2_13670 [soil metagenome]
MQVECCAPCNNGASLDEEYFACLIECVLVGSTEVEKIARENVQRSLARNEKLRAHLESSRSEINGQTLFQPEGERVKRVLLKTARAPAKYENSEPKWENPTHFSVRTLPAMDESEREEFFSPRSVTELASWPEVGSRAMQRMAFALGNEAIEYPWVTVQNGNYAFAVTDDVWNPLVKIVIRDYLAVEIGWE